MSNIKVGDFIRLVDRPLFERLHSTNSSIAHTIGNHKALISKVDDVGDIREIIVNGRKHVFGIYKREIDLCFAISKKEDSDNPTDSYGKFKIIITYVNGETIEEEGVTSIKIKPESVTYNYNRKKYGFLKYTGEVSLELTELKQITVSIPSSERVFHIENGIIIREHVMYDNSRKFKSFNIGN